MDPESQLQYSRILFLPPVYATEPEVVAQTAKSIQELHAQIAEANSQLTVNESTGKDAIETSTSYQTKTKLETELQALRMTAIPFYPSRIPVEILQIIFIHLVHSGQSPWRLTAICRSWRAIVLETPRVWAKIQIQLGRPHSRQKEGWTGDRNLFFSIHHFQSCIIDRVQSAPLDIVIDSLTAPQLPLTDADCWKMLDLAGGERMKNWAVLKLVGRQFHSPKWEEYLTNPNASLSGLQELDLIDNNPSLFTLMDRTTRKLRYLHVRLQNMQSRSIAYLCRPWIKSLEGLYLSVERRGKPAPEGQLLQIVSMCKSLRWLSADILNEEPDTAAPLIPDTLEKLRLHSHGAFYATLLVPSLVYLFLSFQTKDLELKHSLPILLPKLIFLKVNGGPCLELLSLFQCPRLIQLSIGSRDIEHQDHGTIRLLCERLGNGKCILNPEELNIHHNKFDVWLQLMLRHMGGGIKTFFYHGHSPSRLFWESFYDLEGGIDDITCPNLENLILQFYYGSVETELSVKERLEKGRSEIGRPIQRITMNRGNLPRTIEQFWPEDKF